jgi:plastocyanin
MIRILSSIAVFGAVTAAVVPAYAEVTAKAPAAAAVTGSIKGTVLFEGEPPSREEIVRDSDPYCEKVKKQTEDVIVTKGKLKDVLVRIKNGSAGTFTAPTSPVLLDQKDCMYSPRVVGVMVGQKLAVRNSDGTFHNVRGTVAGKQLWNNAQPKKAADLSLDAGPKAGDVVDLKCDVHPWMSAFAVVQDHPFFAVTGEDGAFTITGLPQGSYVLEAWHPQLGKKELKVKIGKGKKAAVTARFSYKATE